VNQDLQKRQDGHGAVPGKDKTPIFARMGRADYAGSDNGSLLRRAEEMTTSAQRGAQGAVHWQPGVSAPAGQ
jgi:hypothetical protein